MNDKLLRRFEGCKKTNKKYILGSGGVQSRPGPPPIGVPSSSQGGRGAPPAYSIPQGGPGHGYGDGRGHYNRNRGEASAVGSAGGPRGGRASSSSANNRSSIY